MIDFGNLLFANECLFVLNQNFQIKKFFPLAISRLHHQESELLRMDLLSLIVETDKVAFLNHLQETLTSGKSSDLEAMIRDSNEKMAFFQWKISLHDSEIFVLGRELLVEKIDRNIAHEINNPLTIVQARSYQLQQMAESGDISADRVKQTADSLYGAAIKIGTIVKGLRKTEVSL